MSDTAAPSASWVEWRVVYDHGGNSTFDTGLDGLAALAEFAQACADGHHPRLLCRIDGGEWLPREQKPAAPETLQERHQRGDWLSDDELGALARGERELRGKPPGA